MSTLEMPMAVRHDIYGIHLTHGHVEILHNVAYQGVHALQDAILA